MFSAQEAGLVIVILLLMAGLTIYGSQKPKLSRAQVPVAVEATVTVAESGDVTVTEAEAGSGGAGGAGRTTVYRASDGWSYMESRRILRRDSTVNRFLERENLVLLTNSAAFIAVMAVGMTAIIVLAGIDLSVGSIYALAAMLGAMALGAWVEPGASAWLSVPVALVIFCTLGALCGLFNGAMIVGLKVHPFIITLGTMAVYRGIVFVVSGGQTASQIPVSMQTGFFKLDVAGVYPIPSLIMVLVTLVGMFVMSRTVFGRRIYAVGGNETAAAYAGVPVGLVKMKVYLLTGLLAGLSACMYVGYFGAAESNAGQAYELKVIAAAVIGGAALSGGRGSAIGAALGAILVELINNAMLIFDVDQSYNQIVMGTAIVLAVVVDQFKTRLSLKGR